MTRYHEHRRADDVGFAGGTAVAGLAAVCVLSALKVIPPAPGSREAINELWQETRNAAVQDTKGIEDLKSYPDYADQFERIKDAYWEICWYIEQRDDYWTYSRNFRSSLEKAKTTLSDLVELDRTLGSKHQGDFKLALGHCNRYFHDFDKEGREKSHAELVPDREHMLKVNSLVLGHVLSILAKPLDQY